MTRSPYFTGPLYTRMAEDLHLGGMSERTHDGYLRAARKLADFCRTSPDKITENQLRRFFLRMKNEFHYAYGTLRVAYSGIKFFYTRTCASAWNAKVRHYGWMSCNSRTSLDEVHWLVWMFLGWVYWLASGYAPQPELEPRRPPTCPSCGGQDDTSVRGTRRRPDVGREPSIPGQWITCHDRSPTTCHDHFSKRRRDGSRESSAPTLLWGHGKTPNESAITLEAAQTCRNRATDSSPIEHSPSSSPSRDHETGRSTEPLPIRKWNVPLSLNRAS